MTPELFSKIIMLLWTINFVPPLLAYYLEDRWRRPLDGGAILKDGRPIFGPHKTIRGVLGAIISGGVAAAILDLPAAIGLATGALSMGGDLLSSFIKRRRGLPSGGNAPGLDQLFEGLLPLFLLAPRLDITLPWATSVLAVFCVGAWGGSILYKQVLFRPPFEGYPRPIRPRLRMKELTSCRLAFRPMYFLFHFEEAFYYHVVIKAFIRAAGLYQRGVANALDIRWRKMILSFPDLPDSFHGYRVVYLSDLHLDGLDNLAERLGELLAAEEADLCLLGGDYRMSTHGPWKPVLDRMERVVRCIRAREGIYAVLGNHDCLEMVEPFKKMGVNVLLNDAVEIRRGERRIFIAGVDDPHYYRCPSLEAAMSGLPEDAFVVLLAHSPEVWQEAAARGVRLYLCGHTHAGQIQIPPFGPVFTHSRSPRAFSQGLWSLDGMTGYTSSGAGVSGVPVRFNTRGEVVVIELRREEMAAGRS